jgi:hypothetical protein
LIPFDFFDFLMYQREFPPLEKLKEKNGKSFELGKFEEL